MRSSGPEGSRPELARSARVFFPARTPPAGPGRVTTLLTWILASSPRRSWPRRRRPWPGWAPTPPCCPRRRAWNGRGIPAVVTTPRRWRFRWRSRPAFRRASWPRRSRTGRGGRAPPDAPHRALPRRPVRYLPPVLRRLPHPAPRGRAARRPRARPAVAGRGGEDRAGQRPGPARRQRARPALTAPAGASALPSPPYLPAGSAAVSPGARRSRRAVAPGG
jgi:hypothetical protein